jgi:hypothetical protein
MNKIDGPFPYKLPYDAPLGSLGRQLHQPSRANHHYSIGQPPPNAAQLLVKPSVRDGENTVAIGRESRLEFIPRAGVDDQVCIHAAPPQPPKILERQHGLATGTRGCVGSNNRHANLMLSHAKMRTILIVFNHAIHSNRWI